MGCHELGGAPWVGAWVAWGAAWEHWGHLLRGPEVDHLSVGQAPGVAPLAPRPAEQLHLRARPPLLPQHPLRQRHKHRVAHRGVAAAGARDEGAAPARGLEVALAARRCCEVRLHLGADALALLRAQQPLHDHRAVRLQGRRRLGDEPVERHARGRRAVVEPPQRERHAARATGEGYL